MSKTLLQFSVLFMVLEMAQAVVFGRIVLFSVAFAFVMVYFIIKLPLELSPALTISASFLLGMVLDIFIDTPGLNALSCTCLGALRRPIARLYIPKDDGLSRAVPSLRVLGPAVFAKFTATMALVYCILVFTVEAFTIFNPGLWILRIVCSAALTTILILALDSLAIDKRK